MSSSETRQIKVPIAGVSDDGSIYGTVTKEMRDHINFDKLMEDSETVEGYAVIRFKK